AAAVPGQRQGPHRARSVDARRLQDPEEDGRAHRAQGVPRPLPLHLLPGRLGRGGGLLARLGRAQRADLTRRGADWRSLAGMTTKALVGLGVAVAFGAVPALPDVLDQLRLDPAT